MREVGHAHPSPGRGLFPYNQFAAPGLLSMDYRAFCTAMASGVVRPQGEHPRRIDPTISQVADPPGNSLSEFPEKLRRDFFFCRGLHKTQYVNFRSVNAGKRAGCVKMRVCEMVQNNAEHLDRLDEGVGNYIRIIYIIIRIFPEPQKWVAQKFSSDLSSLGDDVTPSSTKKRGFFIGFYRIQYPRHMDLPKTDWAKGREFFYPYEIIFF